MTVANAIRFVFYRGTSILALGQTVDGYYGEEHKLKVSKTTYPVESGASLVDHAVREPTKLKLQGWVSDLMPSADAVSTTHHTERSTVAWLEILRVMDDRQPLTVVTALAVYDSMLITSVTAPVDRTTGLALQFTIELEEVLFKNVSREASGTEVPPSSGPAADRLGAIRRGRVLAPVTAEYVVLWDLPF